MYAAWKQFWATPLFVDRYVKVYMLVVLVVELGVLIELYKDMLV